MNTPFITERKTEWYFRDVDCQDGVCGLKVSFSNSSTWSCHKATVYANGKPVGCAMLANASHTDVVCFEIEKISGRVEICIKVGEPTAIHWIDLVYGEKFEPETTAEVENSFTDIRSGTWEATDMLGRHLVSAEQVGERRPDKKVGIFYWTWRDAHVNLRPINLTKLLAECPEAEFDPDHPAWGTPDLQCHWNEPGMGFYRNSDPYVLRKHAVMLADADIDFVVFDCTNGSFLWKDGYEPLLSEFAKARAEGIRAPQVAFMLNFAAMEYSEHMLRALYQDLYRPGKYRDLWFMLDGKPLIMAYPDSLPEVGVCDKDTEILNEIREFFAFRPGQPLYYGGPNGPHKNTQWGWLEMSPQHKYCEREDGSCEMMTVGVAQNARDGRICTYFNDEGTYGRSYTKADGHSKLTEDSYLYGYNFEEQWENALAADPDIIFVTGWNEWQMGRCHECWILDPDSKQIAFVDQYDREHSRDIEPDIDGYLDTYYLQMINYIRRFKGADTRVAPSAQKSIDISGGKSEWDGVLPRYESTCGAINRNYAGYKGCHYVNDTAKNAIMSCRVARDADKMYFYAECADKLTAPAQSGWMTLYLDTDRQKSTGWEGYDVAINRLAPDSGKASVEVFDGDAWRTVGEADIFIGERSVTIAVSRELVGLCGSLDFEFKWSDNMQQASVMDFYYNGDCAPHGRFNYLYKE